MNETKKTTEEIRAELSDRKVAKAYLDEFENGISAKLSRFEGVLANFKPQHQITHEYDVEEVKELKTALNKTTLQLEEATLKLSRLYNIPEKIEILEKKETVVKFSDSTTKFLIYFCGICFVCAVGGASYGINAFIKIEALKKTEFEKGVFKGRNQLYNISTKKSQNLVDKNYPYWNKKID